MDKSGSLISESGKISEAEEMVLRSGTIRSISVLLNNKSLIYIIHLFHIRLTKQ